MGFKKTVELECGIMVVDAYFRVEGYQGDKNTVTYVVAMWKSQDYANEARTDKKLKPVQTFEFTTPYSPGDLIAQAYDHLLKLPSFEGAEVV